MNLEELRTLLEVVDSGSLVAASRRLHVTPSTVTARLNALEEEVGQRLLHRNKSGVELTSAGFKLQRYAQLMTQLWRQARAEVSLPHGAQGLCNVGLEPDLWREVGERLLGALRQRCPAVAVALWPGERRLLERWLDTGLIDVAFGYAPQAGERFASRALFDDPLVLVSTAGPAVQPGAEGYVYVDHGEEFRRQHAAAFAHGRTPAVTIASADWALEYLLGAGGQGYLPLRHCRAALADGRLHRVADAPEFDRRVYLAENTAAVRAWDWYEPLLAACWPD